MSNLGKRKNGKTPFKAKKTTKVTSKSRKLEVESSHEQLEILSVKEHNGQIKIEYRAPSTSAPPIAGTDYETPTTNQAVKVMLTEIKVEDEFGEPSISDQSIPPTDAERHNYPTAIKVEDEVDIKIKDEIEFCDLSYTAQLIPRTDDDNQSNHDSFAEIKVDKIEFEEANISVKSISTTVDDDYKEIEDETELCDEDRLDTPETTVPYKPGEPGGNKKKPEFTCDICSKKYSTKKTLTTHRKRHRKPKFHCPVCDVAKITKAELTTHIRTHDSNSKCFKCKLCRKKFTTQSGLVEHRLCHNKQNFQCTVCGVDYLSQHVLDRHMRMHDTNPFTCDICSKKFTTKRCLNGHRKRHGKPNFNCNVCDAAKFSKSELTKHINRHHESSNKYLRKSTIDRHRLMCHGKPKFVVWPNSEIIS